MANCRNEIHRAYTRKAAGGAELYKKGIGHGPTVHALRYGGHMRQGGIGKAMIPHQRDVQIKMWGAGLNRLSGLCFGAAIFGAFGIRFIDHQVKIGVIAGALLFFAGMHVVRYLSPPEGAESPN